MNVDFQIEMFQVGEFDRLKDLLVEADGKNEEARAAIIELGRYLKEDGAWRSEIKHTSWPGHDNAWSMLQAYIDRNRGRGPWWSILEFAEDQDVSEEARQFFIL